MAQLKALISLCMAAQSRNNMYATGFIGLNTFFKVNNNVCEIELMYTYIFILLWPQLGSDLWSHYLLYYCSFVNNLLETFV